MRYWLSITIGWVLLSGTVWAGSSVRYALIVGNNHAKTPPGVILPDLKHAEKLLLRAVEVDPANRSFYNETLAQVRAEMR